ncbi:MAG: ABC transporter substrate-binding protein [Paludibacteraceae bacterium]|nr:ABC transporter substrate-binding protein [Paludibacteraceae bacterium]MBQ6764508.1 ABC transporter substrate-binding protein [Paludibacteraceae bacterium]
MRKLIFQIPVFVLVLVMTACTPARSGKSPAPGNRYACGFQLRDSADCCIATVFSPWEDGAVMGRWCLRREGELREGDIRVPVSRVAVSSCTHVGFLNAVGALEALAGVCNPEFVYSPLDGTTGAREGTLNLGDGMSPSVERILLAHPDIMMVSTYAQGDVATQQLLKTGVPVVFNNEWMEQTPLARAEWVRFVAAFFDRREAADSVFAAVSARYDSLCSVAATVRFDTQKRRSIVSGQDFRGTWYVPAGATYMGRLFRDAGARYKYADDMRDGSIPLTIEQAVQDFADDADVWVGASVRSLEELRQVDEKHTWFRAWQTGEVYNFLLRSTPEGANDFWERGVVHPDEILADLVKVLYPELLQDTPFTYTSRLEP